MVDEWGAWYEVEPKTNPGFLYQQNTMRDAILAGATLNIFHKHASRVRIANLAQLVNVLQAPILTDGPRMVTTPTYHVLEMYKVHQDATSLPTEVTGPHYVVNTATTRPARGDREGGGNGQNHPDLSQVSASASRAAGGTVHVSLCNLHHAEAET